MEEAEAEVIDLTLDDGDQEAASVVSLSSSDDSGPKYVFASYASKPVWICAKPSVRLYMVD